RERRPSGLLHHLAELAGDGQVSLSRVRSRLDEQDVTSYGRDGEPGRDARVGRAFAHFAGEPAGTEPLARQLLLDADLARVALGDLPCRLPAEVGDPPLEAADARLARVLAD